MFSRVKAFLRNLGLVPPAPGFPQDDPRIAFVALCGQVMQADGRISPEEQAKIRDLARQRFALDGERLDALIETGLDASREAIDYYRFTSSLKHRLPGQKDRAELVATLWDLVYADGERAEIEDHVIWRIADLLGVSGDDLLARHRLAASHRTASVAGDGGAAD